MEVWIGRNGERHGPYQEEQVKEWLRSGQLSPDDLAWYDGLADWRPLSMLFPQDKPAPAPNPYGPPPLQTRPASSTTYFDYAGFWQRFGAWVIDLIVLMIPSMIVVYALGGMDAYKHLLDQIQGGADMATSLRDYAKATEGASVTSLAITFLYYMFFEASKLQATPGKLALRLRVTDVHGQRITLGRSAARNIVRLLGAVFGLIPIVCYLAITWTQHKQGLHDLWASTYVLNGTAQEQPPRQPSGEHGHFNA
ncbi:RDD family protein [Dyella nitratireducens]|uniref:RDD family protein n=1 Tax=Dyella nitratireducens TaxID=1849580 RepID=A0ABQ1GSG0_9GAMM|nr:RDD family protein [Dyella nitratireducens]GGA49495.1 RDD family protein [Dyella nitratireducens]GLQ42171.1 RDD family protein [Dyella nitratireducens]